MGGGVVLDEKLVILVLGGRPLGLAPRLWPVNPSALRLAVESRPVLENPIPISLRLAVDELSLDVAGNFSLAAEEGLVVPVPSGGRVALDLHEEQGCALLDKIDVGDELERLPKELAPVVVIVGELNVVKDAGGSMELLLGLI